MQWRLGTRGALKGPFWALIGLTELALLLLGAPSQGADKRPPWIDAEAPFYSEQEYLTGVGSGDSRKEAEDQAYAAISKIFQAKVQAQARDTEEYRQRGEKHNTEILETVDLRQITEVSTRKVLESVRISEHWEEPRTHVHYALATLIRSQASASLSEKIQALDRQVEVGLDQFEKGGDPLLRWKALRRTEQLLTLREAFNGDLRILRRSGQGIDPPISPTSLQERADRFLSETLRVSVVSFGPEKDALRPALIEGLTGLGFQILKGEEPADLLVGAEGEIKEADLHDPALKFVRWDVRLNLIDGRSGKILATAGEKGREAQINLEEASVRARHAMQREITGPLLKELLKIPEGPFE